MTAPSRPRKRRPAADPRSLTRGDVLELMRRSYNEPIPPPLPLHKMALARRRSDQADATNPKETNDD